MKKEYLVYGFVFIVAISATVFFTRKAQVPSYQETAVVQIPPDVNPQEFSGEVIKLDTPWPSKVQAINLSIHIPPMHKLLVDAKPYLRLSSPKGLIKEWVLEGPQQTLDLGHEVDSDQVSAELELFYCREGNEGLCLYRKVLFQIPIKSGAEFQDVFLSYKLPDDKF